MRKILRLTLITAILLTIASYTQAIPAKEDTAQLTFSKTAVTQKKSSPNAYKVQPGDTLSTIMRRIPNIKQKDIPGYYQITKELNPNITDINRLYAGQTIILPGKIVDGTKKGITPISYTGPSHNYLVKKGDTLSRVAQRVFNIVKANTQKTILLIQSMNPVIKDINMIYIGQSLRIPSSLMAGKPSEQTTEKSSVLKESDQAVSSQENSLEQNTKESIILPPEARLAVIKHVITQMNGTMLTSGNYYLPVSKTTGQITIDCSIIPVVEMDDRTTLFLDFENRSSGPLKKIISEHLNNYHLVKINAKDDVIAALSKIFRNTKTYEMTKAQKPVVIGSLPPLEVIMDWLITKKGPTQPSTKTQGLRLVYENNVLLPRAIVNYARSHAFIITEISPKTGLVGKPEEIYSLPPITILSTASARDFSYDLLSYLNIPAEKDVDISVFNTAQDGFNLSIKADIVATRQEKKTIIFSRHLPPQFVDILQKAGNELIFISDQDEPVKNMEKILRGFHFIFAAGYYGFSGLDKGQPPYHIGFNGTKIKNDKVTYVVNFDFNQELRGLMQEAWSSNIVRY